MKYSISLLIAIAFGALAGVGVMLLWNYCLIGAVNGIHELTYLQAWGISILCNILFKRNNARILEEFTK